MKIIRKPRKMLQQTKYRSFPWNFAKYFLLLVSIFTPGRKKVKSTHETRINDNQPYTIAIHNSSVEYSKLAIQYMFIANGGAITTVLLKLPIEDYFIPIIFFCTGVAYATLIPIVMYFRCKEVIFKKTNEKDNVIKKYHGNLLYRLFICTLMYMPILIFLYGIILTLSIYRDNQLQSPIDVIYNTFSLIIDFFKP